MALLRYTVAGATWRTILDTYMAYVFVLLLLHLLQRQVIVVLRVWSASGSAVFLALRWRYRISLQQIK